MSEESGESGGVGMTDGVSLDYSSTEYNNTNSESTTVTEHALEFSNLETLLYNTGLQLNQTAIENAIRNGESLEYIISRIADGSLVAGGKNRDSGYNNMAVYADTERSPSNEEYQSIIERISKKRQSGQIPSSAIADNPEIIQYNMEAWLSALREFKNDPAKYQALADYVSSIGRQINEPRKAGIFDHQPHAVARTYAGETIEANVEMWQMLENIGMHTGIPSSYLLEMAIAHEYFHSSQPESILRGNPFPIIAEMDVEYNMANFFMGKSKNSPDTYDKLNYENLAKYCLERHAAYAKVLQRN